MEEDSWRSNHRGGSTEYASWKGIMDEGSYESPEVPMRHQGASRRRQDAPRNHPGGAKRHSRGTRKHQEALRREQKTPTCVSLSVAVSAPVL